MRKSNKIALAAGAVALAGAMGLTTFAMADYGRGKGGKAGYHCSSHGKSAKHRGDRGSWRRYTRLMERFDTDGDGKLSQDELDQARRDLLAKHDADGDGKLSLEEFKSLWLEVMHRRMVRSFQRLDTDGDAEITVEEFLKPYSNLVERLDRNEDGVFDKEDRKRRHHRGHGRDRGGDDEKKG